MGLAVYPRLGAAALVVAHEPLQPGAASIRRSVAECVAQVLRGINDVENARLARGWLGQVLIKAGRPSSIRSQTQTLLDALRNQTMYLADPVHMEWVQTAVRTLCLKPGQCNPVEDCDGLSAALATVTILAGIPTQFVEQHWEGAEQDHILIAVRDESGNWLKVDPSTPWPVGRSATADREVWVDPLRDVTPQLVALGRLPIYEQRYGKTWVSVDGSSWVETLGAATSTTMTAPAFDVAASDLHNQMELVIQAGDTYLSANDYKGAVSAYQAAGMAGATSIGPEIDLAGSASVTQPLTYQAWTLNAALAAVDASTANASSASDAQKYVKRMLSLYQQAIAQGRNAALGVPEPPEGGNVGGLRALGIAAGVGAAAGLGYYLWRRSSRSRRRR